MLFFYEYFNELWLPKGIDAKDQILNFKFFHDFNKFMPEEELEFKFKFEIPAKTTGFWVSYNPLSTYDIKWKQSIIYYTTTPMLSK